MTKREAQRQTQQENVLIELGFTAVEADQLRRISIRLHRWYERECGDGNGCIERDDTTDKPLWRNASTGRAVPIRDDERGAERRLAAIMEAHNDRAAKTAEFIYGNHLRAYLQTDPRGATLYILRPGDVPEGADISGYYSRGICVY